MLVRHFQWTLVLLRVGDAAAALVAWLAAFLAWSWLGPGQQDRPAAVSLEGLLPSIVVTVVLAVLIFDRFSLYEPKRCKTIVSEVGDLGRAIIVVWAVHLLLTLIVPSLAGALSLNLLLLVGWLLIGGAERAAGRALLRWMRERGWNLRTAAIVGAGRLGQKACHVLRQNRWMGIEPEYFIADDAPGRELLGLEVAGPVDGVDRIVNSRPVDIVFVALPARQTASTRDVLDRLMLTPADVRVVPDLLAAHLLRHDATMVEDLPIITLTYSPQHGWHVLLKRALDLAVALPALALLAVPMLIIAAAVRLTGSGPVFYRQRRASLEGRQFSIIKFRTMVQDAERGVGPVWALPDDPRVTRVGRFLRRTGLDELPQLLNVAAGRMSLVGPRPERPEFIQRFREEIPRYMLRHHVKTGLTGWAQVHGLRGRTSLRKRIQYDLYYIMNWSLGLDLLILGMTLVQGLRSLVSSGGGRAR